MHESTSQIAISINNVSSTRYEQRLMRVLVSEKKLRLPHRTKFRVFSGEATSLLPLNAQETLVLYRPRAAPHQTRLPVSTQQLWLFELVHTG
jgi:hypothetical protein